MQRQKSIAIIGSGISGLTAAYLLSQKYRISLYESESRLGGHTHTVSVPLNGDVIPIDTGFIVFNEHTYPNFCRLMKELGVESQATEMSFSFKNSQTQFEYNGHSLNSLFAQRSNLLSPRFYRFVLEIKRFFAIASAFLQQNDNNDILLTEFVRQYRFSNFFVDCYLLPMAAAIWSCPTETIRQFPARFVFQFYQNHGLLNVVERPQWYTLRDGARQYIQPMIQRVGEIFVNTPIKAVQRDPEYVTVHTRSGYATYDYVIMATHSDQALRLLDQASYEEQHVLGAIPYQANEVALHTDISVLPRSRLAWASWNYHAHKDNDVQLTYYMNRLQNLDTPVDFCVSVNANHLIDKQKLLASYQYSHPVFSQQSLSAQAQWHTINGTNRTYFCGAYWRNGFHEDGVYSALRVAKALGVDW